MQDYSGNDSASITDYPVVNNRPDTTPPAFVSAATSADGSKVVMTYSEALSATTAAAGAFTVRVNGTTVSVSSVAVTGSTVALTLASPATSGDSITVA